MYDLQTMAQMFGQGGAGQGLQMGGGITGMQPGGAPMVPGMGAQGLQGAFPGLTPDEATLNKLANAPIDPAKIMALFEQQQGAQPAHAQAVAPAAGRNIQPMQQVEIPGSAARGGLAQFLG